MPYGPHTLKQADELDIGTAEDRRLAQGIRSFVADMPIPLTRQQLLASQRKLAGDDAATSPRMVKHIDGPQQHSKPSNSLQRDIPVRILR